MFVNALNFIYIWFKKKNDYLEYAHSTIHQEICYDKNLEKNVHIIIIVNL